MIMRKLVITTPLFVIACLVTSVAAQQEASKKELTDLTAVIALQGQPCGEVVSATVLKQNDYAATCKDGNKYHVYQNEKGRVVVEKQSDKQK
jgi:hypothetical protein